ncbi:hypothetical protein [Clostridium sardiniense]|uniref:hypothetical protein n=1 Tax=Clostridium sardiniense TaxID=29369 RepID=UPI00195A4B5C|nr:hypothetical protein [Clostridium sardiniense]MBM7834877.1 hypothetical protein [Clostridium sardiniense]
MKLTYEISKERYEEILEKPLNKKLESLNTIKKSKFYRVFLAIAIPLFSLVLLIGILADGIESTVKLFPRIVSCIVLLFIYFELLFKIVPKIQRKVIMTKGKSLIENRLFNVNKLIKFVIEIDKKSIRQYGGVKSTEISYCAIDEVNIFEDFIHIEYLKSNIIYIPLEAFNNEDELEQCYKIIKENIKSSKDEKLSIDNSDFSYIKREDDIRNLNKYIFTTKEGDLIIKATKEVFLYSLILVAVLCLIIITCLISFKYGCMSLIVFAIVILLTRTKMSTDRIKKAVLKEEVKNFNNQNKNISITFKDDGIQFYQEDNICTIKYEGIKSIEESNGLILLKNDLLLAYIPNRIFKSEGKQKVINILKSKCNIL